MRTQLAYLLAEQTGAFGFLDCANLPRLNGERYEHFMDKCRDAYGMARTGEPFDKHFHDRYGDHHGLPPYWMLVNVMDFGMVVTLYKGSPVSVWKQIADDLGVSTKVLDSWLVTVNTVRDGRTLPQVSRGVRRARGRPGGDDGTGFRLGSDRSPTLSEPCAPGACPSAQGRSAHLSRYATQRHGYRRTAKGCWQYANSYRLPITP